MSVELVIADDNRIYLAVVDEDDRVMYVFAPLNMITYVGDEVTVLADSAGEGVMSIAGAKTWLV